MKNEGVTERATEVEKHTDEIRYSLRRLQRRKDAWRTVGMLTAPSSCASLAVGLYFTGIASVALLATSAVLWASLLLSGYKIWRASYEEDKLEQAIFERS